MSKFRVGLIIGLGTGFVLGARAGRERYEQIARVARTAWNSQTSQWMRTEVTQAMPPAVGDALHKVSDLRHRNGGMPAARLPA